MKATVVRLIWKWWLPLFALAVGGYAFWVGVTQGPIL